MAIIKSYKGMSPQIAPDCYLSENATVVGDVTMGSECSIWFGAVVRGDVAPVTMGKRSNVQDCAVVHVTNTTGPTVIGDDVTIGHCACVHACTIGDGALIGMNATVLDGAVVGKGAIIAAGALVLQGTVIGDGELWGGVPAKFLKMAKPGMAQAYAQHYVEYAREYMSGQ